jgi:hypothetical protein
MTRRSLLALAAAPVLTPAGSIEDKIRGGFLGQVLGDLNGLRHEMKYILEPGDVREYTPALPTGAWTDDDTDIEWPYVLEIERTGRLLIPYPRISELWRKHINRRIWCSHLYLRQLMDLGIDPPLTGRVELNPWADFNLSGQFVSETWGLISPGMPRTAARLAAYYTHVSVDGEPVQSAQMMAAMIATAFVTGDIEKILDAGAAAVDPASVMRRIVGDVRRWHRENPRDWRATRRLTRDAYCRYGGQDMRDRNGVWLNGASAIAALLYGAGDFVETLRHAFNFGWDADNNAAAAGAIAGAIKGHRYLMSQGWQIRDLYRNTSRDAMPDDETLTSYGTRLVALARLNKVAPANVEPLPDLKKQYAAMRAQSRGDIDKGMARDATAQQKARAAYLAVCLDFAPELKGKYPEAWSQAVAALAGYPRVLQVMFYQSGIPAGETLRQKALAAGLVKPGLLRIEAADAQ